MTPVIFEKTTISMAVMAASQPLLPALVLARSMACLMVTVVTPKAMAPRFRDSAPAMPSDTPRLHTRNEASFPDYGAETDHGRNGRSKSFFAASGSSALNLEDLISFHPPRPRCTPSNAPSVSLLR